MKFQPKYAIIAACSLLPVALLSSCAKHTQPQPKPLPPPKYKVATAPASLYPLIRSAGVQVIQQGSRLQMILPVDKFFRLQSTEIKSHQISTLKQIAAYLKDYLGNYPVKPVIYVSGHTDTVFNRKDRRQLSRQYAEVVAAYLWRQGFSHQQLRVKGAGATKDIANPKSSQGAGFNRRVVIQVNPM